MENSLNKIHLFFKDAMPYMVLLIIVLLLVNIAKLREAQDDIARVQHDIDYVRSDLSDLLEKSKSSGSDNADVIYMIREHHEKISRQIDEAERQIKANTVIWSK